MTDNLQDDLERIICDCDFSALRRRFENCAPIDLRCTLL